MRKQTPRWGVGAVTKKESRRWRRARKGKRKTEDGRRKAAQKRKEEGGMKRKAEVIAHYIKLSTLSSMGHCEVSKVACFDSGLMRKSISCWRSCRMITDTEILHTIIIKIILEKHKKNKQ